MRIRTLALWLYLAILPFAAQAGPERNPRVPILTQAFIHKIFARFRQRVFAGPVDEREQALAEALDDYRAAFRTLVEQGKAADQIADVGKLARPPVNPKSSEGRQLQEELQKTLAPGVLIDVATELSDKLAEMDKITAAVMGNPSQSPITARLDALALANRVRQRQAENRIPRFDQCDKVFPRLHFQPK